MQLTITIPDNQLKRVCDAFCEKHCYVKKINPMNPESLEDETQFLKNMIIDFIKETTLLHESEKAILQARNNMARNQVSIVIS